MIDSDFKKAINIITKAKKKGVLLFLDNERVKFHLAGDETIQDELIAEIKKYKDEIRHILGSNDFIQEAADIKRIYKTNRDSVSRIPLSFSQERLWVIDQLEGSVSYHIPVVLRLRGRLNEDSIRYALQEIVSRHEVLRTVIDEEGGHAYQRVVETGGWKLESSEPGGSMQDPASWRSYIGGLISRPFDLAADYKLRAHLIRLNEKEAVLVVVLHHIASDGWSNAILVNEFKAFYKAHISGSLASLSPLPVQYADYAIWQRRYITGEVLEKKLGYWKSRLANMEPLNLPTDYLRPVVQGTRGASIRFELDAELTAGLHALSHKEGATLFMTLLAVFNVLLYRYSDHPDIAIGTPVAGRQQQEIEGLIGFFVNTLVLRSDLSGNPVFREFLQQVKETTLGAFDNQEIPFEKVVEAVVKERDASRSPLIQVVFALQNNSRAAASAGSFGNLELLPELPEHTTSKFDLTFLLGESPTGLEGNIEYCTDLYREETISRMALHYKELLQAVVAAPDLRIGKLQMLPFVERSALLGYSRGLAGGVARAIRPFSLLGCLSGRIGEGGDRIAVVHRGRGLSYGELNRRIE
ncbi:condensation domain-containing protein, partial [Flavitalea flava]